MGVRKYQELIAWQLAEAFKDEVFGLMQRSRPAMAEHRYRGQIFDGTTSISANIVEGFLRCSPGEFAHYLGISLGSLGEVENRLRDGIKLGYFPATDCALAFRFGRRCGMAILRLKQSQIREAKRRRSGRRPMKKDDR